MELAYSILTGIITGCITGVSAYTAIRVEIKYLRRDVDALHKRFTHHLEIHHGTSD